MTKDEALKDLEIMRLREALEIARDYQFNAVNQFHIDFAGYKAEKHKQYDDDLKLVEQALSAPATYDDLMAWHEAQLGEPVAWMNSANGVVINKTKKQQADYSLFDTPVYAKKGLTND